MPLTSQLLIDFLARGGACALLGFVAVLLIRDGRGLKSRWLILLFVVGGIAYGISALPGFFKLMGPWGIPISAAATGDTVVLWVLAWSLFDDDFRFRPWQGLIWLLLVGLQCLNEFRWLPWRLGREILSEVLTFQAPFFAGLAMICAGISWRDDLVEPRRRLRAFLFVACAAYVALSVVPDLLGTSQDALGVPNLLTALGLLALALTGALQMTGLRSAGSEPVKPAASKPASISPPADQRFLARLEFMMTSDRAYRQDGLTVAALAAALSIPEYKLRRVINQELGHRNFAAYVNGYRIQEAIDALKDVSQREVPILTIALDAGFSSLGPFNRAFKATTRMTPTDYRALHAPVEIENRPSRISNSA